MSTLMGKMTYLLETKNAIKNAIIAKDVNVSDNDTFRSYAEKISKIKSGGTDLIQKTITANGTYDHSDDNVDGYSKVIVNVNPTLKEKTITENGTYNASADNADGYSRVTVNIEGSGNIWLDNEDKTLTIKIAPDGNVRIYFNGFVLPTGTNQIYSVLPNNPEMWCYLSWPKNRLILTKSYVSDVDDTQNGWIGMYQNTIRGWNVPKSSNIGGTFWGVLDLNGNNYEDDEQTNPYEEPTYD